MKFKAYQIIVIAICILGMSGAILYGAGAFDSITKRMEPEVIINAKAAAPTAVPAPITTPTYTNVPITTPSPKPAQTAIPTTAPNSVPNIDSAPVQASNPLTGIFSYFTIYDEMEKVLKINLDNTQNYYTDISWEFLDYQMANQDAARTKASGFSDAVSFPFEKQKGVNLDSKSTSYDYDYMFCQLKEEILRSPVYCDMVIRGLKDIRISSGKTIGDLNPWMQEFVDKMDNSMKIDRNTHPRGNEYWLTFREGSGSKVYVTNEFRNYAVRTCLLLERLKLEGVQAWKSTWNYILVYTATNSDRRTELAPYQENHEALIFRYVRKDGLADFAIGFNLLDKRIEYFKDKGVSGGGNGDPVGPIPTPVPTDPPKPIPTDPPKPVPTEQPGTKNKAADPVNQGNADRGGGENKPTDGAGTFQPEKPKAETPVVAGSPESGPRDVTPSTPTKPVVEGTKTTTEGGKTTIVETKVDQNNTVVEKTTVVTPATPSTPEKVEVSTVFNPDPPPAAPAVVPETDYVDAGGNEVSISSGNVFNGEISLPD